MKAVGRGKTTNDFRHFLKTVQCAGDEKLHVVDSLGDATTDAGVLDVLPDPLIGVESGE